MRQLTVIPDSGLCVPLFFPGVLGYGSKLHLAHPESWARRRGPGQPAGRRAVGLSADTGLLLPPTTDRLARGATLSRRPLTLSSRLPCILFHGPCCGHADPARQVVLPTAASATGELPAAAGSGWVSWWVNLPHLDHNLSSLSFSVVLWHLCLVCMCVLSHSVVSDSLQPHGLKPARLLCPWNSPGKNSGVGCYFLLQGILPTQGLNPGLLYFRWILCHLSHQGSLFRVWCKDLVLKALKPCHPYLSPS